MREEDYFRAHFYITDNGEKVPELAHLGLQPDGEYRKLFPDYKPLAAYALIALLSLGAACKTFHDHNARLEQRVSHSFLFEH